MLLLKVTCRIRVYTQQTPLSVRSDRPNRPTVSMGALEVTLSTVFQIDATPPLRPPCRRTGRAKRKRKRPLRGTPPERPS